MVRRKTGTEAEAEAEMEWTGPVITVQFLSPDSIICRFDFGGAGEPQIASAGQELETVARLMRENRIWKHLEEPQRKLGFVQE